MSNQTAAPPLNTIVCPHCGKSLSGNPIIDAAANGTGVNTQFVLCDCGERITYWQITALLRDQKTVGRRLQNWFQSLTRGKS